MIEAILSAVVSRTCSRFVCDVKRNREMRNVLYCVTIHKYFRDQVTLMVRFRNAGKDRETSNLFTKASLSLQEKRPMCLVSRT